MRVKNASVFHPLIPKDFRKTLNRNSEILKFLMIKNKREPLKSKLKEAPTEHDLLDCGVLLLNESSYGAIFKIPKS